MLRTTLLLLIAAVMLVACGQETPQTTLSPHSESARTIYDLSVYLFWLGVGVFLIVEIWLIVSIIKYRHRYDDQLPAQIHGNTKVEIAWTIVPAIIAIFIFVITFSAIQKIEIKPESTAANPELRVEVIGHQWWWEFRYPDIKDVNGQVFETANELWVPSGRVVDMQILSDDVIHDFWIPGLAGKRDAIPNKTDNFIWFQADDVPDGAPKTFWGQCAEYCGTQHAYMKMRVIVASPSDFDQWVDEQTDVAVNVNAPASFAARGCVGCHSIRGVPGAAGVTGPNLTHFGSRQTIAAGTL
ncbi:MAG TPA: cytochrome c oxidase subunit II, partial [Herpetosiphonaceae bacterium]|nr:cytochrome c oxidase subunit II [Herpetosiphonaceae bacterium]